LNGDPEMVFMSLTEFSELQRFFDQKKTSSVTSECSSEAPQGRDLRYATTGEMSKSTILPT